MLIRLEQKRPTPVLNETGQYSLNVAKYAPNHLRQDSLLVVAGLQVRRRRPSLMGGLGSVWRHGKTGVDATVCESHLEICPHHLSWRNAHRVYKLECHLFCKEGAWVLWSFCLYFCICFDLEWSLLKSSRNLYCGNRVSKKPSKKTYTILLFSWLCWNISKTRRIPFRVVSAPMMCFSSSVRSRENTHVHSADRGKTCLHHEQEPRI